MLEKIYKIGFITGLAILPIFIFAQLEETRGILDEAKDIITTVIVPLVFILALLFFFWGVAKYIWSEGQGKAEGKQIMIWGVVALFVMSSVWGIVKFIQGEFNLDQGTEGTIPTIK